MEIISVAGARPNFMKIALKSLYITIQKHDELMKEYEEVRKILISPLSLLTFNNLCKF